MLKKKEKHLIEKETFLPFWLLGSAVVSAIAHNAIFGIMQKEDAVFFLLSILLLLAFFASIIYVILLYLNHGKPKDIWKLGWLGVFGVLSIFAPIMTFFYAFFGFFGLKKK